MTLVPNQKLGPYTIVEQIAVGGMAEIYLVKTGGSSLVNFEKHLALKIIHPNYADDEQFVQMLIDEAKISVGLSHSNICQIFDLGRFDDIYYISMEFIDGFDLFKTMRSLSEVDIDVPIDCAMYIVKEMLQGLSYAHRHHDRQGRPLNIIHRDISPQNILLSKTGDIKIVDFGIAKAASSTRKTQAGVIKGKYYYMSPEQAWGDKIDQRTDIFSAGIILYEVLTGQMLYLEEDIQRLIDRVRRAEFPPPSFRRPEIPRQLDEIVMKALKRDLNQRWQSAQDFQHALSQYLEQYSPGYTSEGVVKLVKEAMGSQLNNERDLIATHSHDDLLLDRSELPADEQSVIFNMNQFKTDLVDHDIGESTRVSAPPAGMFIASKTNALDSAEFELIDEGPTLITKANKAKPNLHAPPVSEVIVPHHIASGAQALAQSDPTTPSALPPEPWLAFPTGEELTVTKKKNISPDELSSAFNSYEPTHNLDGNEATFVSGFTEDETTQEPTRRKQTIDPSVQAMDPNIQTETDGVLPSPLFADISDPLVPEIFGRPKTIQDSISFQVTHNQNDKSNTRWFFIILGLLFFALGTAVAALLLWPTTSEKPKISVKSVPEGARVRIDGILLKTKTPVVVAVKDAKKTYKVVISLKNYESYETLATLNGSPPMVEIVAPLNPSRGTIVIDSKPSGADLFIKKEHRGVTPTVIKDLSLSEPIELSVRKKGFKEKIHRVEWSDRTFHKALIVLEKSR